MLHYILRRILIIIPTLIGISLVTFTIIHIAPGDPISTQYGGALSKKSATTQQYAQQMRKMYHLDEPILKQYGRWLLRLITLDFGKSMVDSRSVSKKILERLPLTLYLNILSFIMIFLISIPLGSYAALHRNQRFDKLSNAVLFILYSMPVPWVALILLLYGGVELNLFPITGIVSDHHDTLNIFGKISDILAHSVMPVFCLTYGSLAFVSKLTRTSMLEVLNQDFIKAAHARGLTRRKVLLKHGLKNAFIPIITLFGSLFPTLISGSVIIERIFSLPGIGQLFFESVMTRDYTTIMGLSFFSAVMTLIGILIADILYALVDPRISYAD